jgi:hypothetical protein
MTRFFRLFPNTVINTSEIQRVRLSLKGHLFGPYVEIQLKPRRMWPQEEDVVRWYVGTDAGAKREMDRICKELDLTPTDDSKVSSK